MRFFLALALDGSVGLKVKSKRSIRVIPLLPETFELLESYITEREEAGEQLSPDSPLFTTTKHKSRMGQHLSRRGIRVIVNKYLRKTGLKKPQVSAHSLRHTCATLALRNGSDIVQVQYLLGHQSLATTSIYTHIKDRWEFNPARNVLNSIFLKDR